MIALASDHGGYTLKQQVISYLKQNQIPHRDFGCTSAEESCDYPDMAIPACKAVLTGECRLALLFCGTGIGISIAANKIKGIRAACCSDYFSAKYTRMHNDANVLCMGGRVVGAGLACEMVAAFLNTPFEGDRHLRRIKKLHKLETQF